MSAHTLRRRFTCARGIVAITLAASVASAMGVPGAGASTIASLSRAALPTNALATSQHAAINGVSCTSTNTCYAVGSYQSAAGNVPLLLREFYGRWTQSVSLPLPSGAIQSHGAAGPITALNSISCATVLTCVAVGTFLTSSGFEALIGTLHAGVWTTSRAHLPIDAATAGQLASLFSVSCTSATTCMAVGTYTTKSGEQLALSLYDSAGIWISRAATLPTGALTKGQFAHLDGVDCATSTRCVAVGSFVDASGYELMALGATSGHWDASSASSIITPPAGHAPLATAEGNSLNAVACPATGACVAVGQYGTPSGYVGLSSTLSTGSWSGAVSIPSPSAPTFPGQNAAVLASLSCTRLTACTAAGSFGNASLRLPMSTTLVGSTWSSAVAGSAALADATAPPSGEYHAVACFGPATCLMVGNYRSHSGIEGLTLTPATTPGRPTGVIVARANAAIFVRWSAPKYDGTRPITKYVATATPGLKWCSAATPACVIRGLTNGQRYTVSVTAINVVGSSAPSIPSASVAPATVPTAPTITSVTPLIGAIKLTLKAPHSNGGAMITMYQFSTDAGKTWHNRNDGRTSLTITIFQLLRRHTYFVAIRAVNGAGTGASSSIKKVTTQ